MAVCEKYNVPLIEDAAESIGSKYKGIQSGTMGNTESFHYFRWWALISNNVEKIEKARFLATQARDPAIHYEHS